VGGHTETWRLRSTGFKRWLRNTWYRQKKCGLASAVAAEAIETLDAMAVWEGELQEVYIRVCHADGMIFVDLCDADWRVVRIDRTGWQVTQETPIKFVRTKGMLPLPIPESGRKLDELLRPLINAADQNTWRLLVAWMLGCYCQGPFPVLIVLGEHGSAKSFLCKTLRSLVDPSEVSATTAPKDARDVIIAAKNSYVVNLDNLSGVPVWLSDLACGISTGTASRERELYTNDDECLFKAKRPVVLNGIDLALRDDLLSRALLVSLPVILDDHRRDEKELLKKLADNTPHILGAIFDTLSVILTKLPDTKLAKKPRMSDFATWVTAGETALDWNAGDFVELYGSNLDNAVELALESDPFGGALRSLVESRSEWSGTWQQLLHVLCGDKVPRGWPDTAKAVANRLKRLAPALRHFQIHYEAKRDSQQRTYKLWRNPSYTSDLSAVSPDEGYADDCSQVERVINYP
jgi:hypothetical protein